MKIAITNNIALNGGDAAILFGMMRALKQRFGDDTAFVVSGSHPEVCRRLYPDIEWRNTLGRMADNTPFNHIRYVGRVLRYAKRIIYFIAAYLIRYKIPLYKLLLSKEAAETLEQYASSDYIVSSGGTYLIEPYGVTSQYIDYRISLILGKPLIMYTQSMGPFWRKSTKQRMQWVFNRCQTIFLRDNKSADNVRSLGVNDEKTIHVVPDAAFALGDIEAINARENDAMNKYRNVAISVRHWEHCSNKTTMPNYRRCIADVAMRLIDKGYTVHFISTCQGVPAYTDDNAEVDNILNLIPDSYKDRIVKYDEHLSISRIMALLQKMDFIIATRLHMSILSLISGTPVFPIAYEFKTVELYRSLGYDQVDELEKLDINSLYKNVEEFIDWYDIPIRKHINNEVANYITLSMSVPQHIK